MKVGEQHICLPQHLASAGPHTSSPHIFAALALSFITVGVGLLRPSRSGRSLQLSSITEAGPDSTDQINDSAEHANGSSRWAVAGCSHTLLLLVFLRIGGILLRTTLSTILLTSTLHPSSIVEALLQQIVHCSV